MTQESSGEINICRPKDGYWCTECCRQNCPLSSKETPGGCLGWDGQQINGMTRTQTCEDLKCWEELTIAGEMQTPVDILTSVIEELNKIKPGKFKISEIYRKVGVDSFR